ncbi:MAG: carboxypeptidase-like regulatory domain-containing protein [Prolixibacteraceae bacterium]|nr:carboxypeptidase-like regulatory domain-containing protein [Prolixibacteraceae bacterium]MBN2774833.1 carboxypeptidase-like regulatory domain-containing protein [Prolixibacteraceae bacterium]
MKTILLLTFFVFIQLFLSGQGIKGTILDTEGQPVAFANIYVPELKKGTTSNHLGQFELKLPEGEWEILFQYLGYKTISQKFTIGEGFDEIKISMQPQSIKIKEIKVLASGEDPAYYVMRRAIAMAPYYKSQVSEYDCNLYLKGSGHYYKIPKLLKKQFKKEGVEEGDSYVMESMNNIHFKLPDKLEQKVVAIRSTGDERNTSPMSMITNNLYNVGEYGVVSPVGKNAMSEYKFKLVGVFEDQGVLINQIKVIPKHKQQGVFDGTINIVEDYWNIHSADLNFTLPIMDVKMHQLYGLVENNTWMPVSLDFSIDLKILGIGMTYVYVASLSDYSVKLNPELDHSFFEKLKNPEMEPDNNAVLNQKQEVEIVQKNIKESGDNKKINKLLEKENLSNRDMRKVERLMNKQVERSMPPEPLEIIDPVKILPGAKKNDSVFWAGIRPIPLTENENGSFAEKDSLTQVQKTPEYQDSIRNVKRKFHLKDLAVGRIYRYDEDSVRYNSWLKVSGLINPFGLTFNTVDGFNYTLPFSYNLTDTIGKSFYTEASVGYAFSRKKVNTDFRIYYLYNGIKRQWINITGGIKASDFKRNQALSTMENDFYSLFFEDNFQKFYENRYINILWGTDIINGLQLRAGFQYSRRSPLENHSDYKFIDLKNKDYTPNIPEIRHLNEWQTQQSKASVAQVRLTYIPKQRYRIRNNRKYPAYSDKPTYTLYYEKGIDKLLGSDVNYDFISASVNQSLTMGINSFEYSLTFGGFLNSKKLYTPDFKYFNSNNQMISFSKSANKFYNFNYYKSLQSGYFIEGHAHFNLENFFLTRLPLVNRTMLSESIGVNYLSTGLKNHYSEIIYSLNNIFLLMDAGFVVSFENLNFQSFGFRLGINLE